MATNLTASGEILVNTTTANSQYFAGMTTLGDGGWIVTWTANGDQDGNGTGVYLQRYAADGTLVGTETLVNTETDGSQYGAVAAGLEDGGWIVTWSSYDQDGSMSGVYQQRYGADGNTVGEETLVNTTTDLNQQSPSVTGLNDGGWVVTFQMQTQYGSSLGIYQQRYDVDGNTVGGETLVVGYDDGAVASPVVTDLDDGGWIVAWDFLIDGSRLAIQTQRYDADGTAVGDIVQIDPASSVQSYEYPSITVLEDGGWMVAWSVDGSSGESVAIAQQRYDAEGNPVGGVTDVATGDHFVSPAVTALADGGWVVTWSAFDDDTGYDVFAQRYDADGKAVGGEIAVNTTTAGWQTSVEVTALPDGGFVIAWDSDDQDGDEKGVYQRTFGAPIIGDDGANALNGTAGDDVIKGNGGNDTINGGAGADTMIGGAGNDLFIVNKSGDKAFGGSGTDQVLASASFRLSNGTEDLRLTGSGDINGTGNSAANTLAGNGGDNRLSGLGGNDSIVGNDGNDTINGGAGADTMAGGAGNDLFIVDNSGDKAFGVSGIDQVLASVSFRLSNGTEDLRLTGSGDINGTGNSAANTIAGNSGDNSLSGLGGNDSLVGNGGNDTINGGGGADTMAGGAGNDLFIVNNSGDKAFGGSGTDQVLASASFRLSNGTEDLRLTGSGDINGTGNSAANTIVGNGGNNSLSGNNGDDHLYGRGGSDQLFGGSGADVMNGGGGNDHLSGGSADDRLIGGSGNDRFVGGGGDDRIIGGGGNDMAIYGGGIGRYEVTEIGSGRIKVVDTRGTFGTDILSDVEYLKFGSKVFKVAKVVQIAEQADVVGPAHNDPLDLGLSAHHIGYHDDLLS